MAERVKRKISAILSADVVGYSKLMEADEEATVRTVESYRRTVSSLVEQHDGRVIDAPGDNVLAEFPSVVDAVQCAVEAQHVIRAKNAGLPEARRMEFRIGINLGDVIEEDDRTYGDGVNIASRIEGIADAGGICISESAYQQIKSKLSFGYEDLGEHSVKNISEPVRVYRIPMGSGGATESNKTRRSGEKRWRNLALSATAALVIAVAAGSVLFHNYISKPSSSHETEKQGTPATPDKKDARSLSEMPSIAVLAFENISDDPKQEYFVDGMTEEIISRLSMNPMLAVIARNSTFTYKGAAKKIRDIGRELGARYIVEGSVRKEGNQLRIAAQLIDADTENHIWSQTYDREMKDVFALQDEIAQQIVAALHVKYATAEMERVRRIPTGNLTAYDAVLRGNSLLSRYTKDENDRALEMFERAVELDSEYALAYVGLGAAHYWSYSLGWNRDPAVLEQAYAYVLKAITIDDYSPPAHGIMAAIYSEKGQPDNAVTEAERAISLSPNDPAVYTIMASILLSAGNPEEALTHTEKAVKLNPHYGIETIALLAQIYGSLGRNEEAIATWKTAIVRKPDVAELSLGLANAHKRVGEYLETIALLEDLIDRRPNLIAAYRDLSFTYIDTWATQKGSAPQYAYSALDAARKCAELAGDSAACHWAVSIAHLWNKQFDEAIVAAEELAESDPGNPANQQLLSHVYSYAKKPEAALAAINRMSRSSANALVHAIGLICNLYGRQDEAISAYNEALVRNPNYEERVKAHIGLTVVYSELGSTQEARSHALEILELSPNFSVDVWGERVPYKDPAQTERDMAALRKAGLPD